jgi:hypothetical protein
MTLRVLVWATTFGADLWSFTKWMDARDDVDVRVVMGGAAAYRRQAVARLFPLRAPVRERRPWHHLLGWPGFAPDLTLLDNWVPKRAVSPRGMVLWHGFGWKGPNDRAEMQPLYDALARAWDDPCRPSAKLRWCCFGPSDLRHRTEVAGLAPDNCRSIGAASHDDLRVPLERGRVADAYPFDVVSRKTVLLAPTWHYGEVFAHWGTDAELLARLLDRIEALGANAILRLHDRYRFAPAYVERIETIARAHRNVLVKFKDTDPDNFVDLQVADVLVTNFSSIANLFYATGRPTIHVYPVRHEDEAFVWRTMKDGKLHSETVESARYVWKFPPEHNGGLLARSFDEVMQQLERALAEPDCCRERSEAFVREHMLGADGQACARAFAVARELCGR